MCTVKPEIIIIIISVRGGYNKCSRRFSTAGNGTGGSICEIKHSQLSNLIGQKH